MVYQLRVTDNVDNATKTLKKKTWQEKDKVTDIALKGTCIHCYFAAVILRMSDSHGTGNEQFGCEM